MSVYVSKYVSVNGNLIHAGKLHLLEYFVTKILELFLIYKGYKMYLAKFEICSVILSNVAEKLPKFINCMAHSSTMISC